MELAELTQYANIVIVGICLCVGYIIKNAIPSEKINRFIPLISGVLGTFLAVVNNLHSLSLEVILMGLFSGLASTGLYEMFRNLIRKEK